MTHTDPAIVELTEDVSGSAYYSRDMAPIPRAGRKWGTRDLAVLWISMSACIPTYMLASALIEKGMDWKQAVATIFLGNCVVLIPMILNAHAGTRYGIPFPVYCRAAFGIRGANIPALMRALTKFTSPFVLVFSMISLGLATLATNIAANVVGPANDFAHLRPKLISFRVGGLITGIIGILIQPWRILADASVYIDKWLIGYSLLLGACGGVLIADYYLIRRTKLDLPGLYRAHGPYWYLGGFNPCAIIALTVGIGLCLPGFLAQIGPWNIHGFWAALYGYAWFVSFGTALATYCVLMKTLGRWSNGVTE